MVLQRDLERCDGQGVGGGSKGSRASNGDEENPEYFCTLVAKNIKKDKREDLSEAPPPLEAKALLFSFWASVPGMRLDFGDVVRAYFHARARRRAHVELSKEDFEEGRHGLLNKAIRGTRDSAQNWEMEYTEMMVGAGFRQGSHRDCVFYREEKSVRVVARGDDTTALGPSKSLDCFRGVFQQHTEVKFEGRLGEK